jgi:hypothetical protein
MAKASSSKSSSSRHGRSASGTRSKSAGKTNGRSSAGRSSARASGARSAKGRASGGRSSAGSSSSRGRASSTSQFTTDHDEIRRWAEERGGVPSCVRGTGGGGDTGLLRIDFPGYSGEGKLQKISWDEFFKKFDEQNLALLYQEQTANGQKSNFNKLVSRDTAQQKQSGSRSRSSNRGRASGGTTGRGKK